jgi:hypothetical protein
MKTYGADDWVAVASAVGGKTVRQCKERWWNYLAPELNSGDWTLEDDQLLLQKFRELGNKWVRIAKCFPNRTDTMVKNRFNKLQRKERKSRDLWAHGGVFFSRMFAPIAKPIPPGQEFAVLSPQPFRDDEMALLYRPCDHGSEADPWSDHVVGDEWHQSFACSVDAL